MNYPHRFITGFISPGHCREGVVTLQRFHSTLRKRFTPQKMAAFKPTFLQIKYQNIVEQERIERSFLYLLSLPPLKGDCRRRIASFCSIIIFHLPISALCLYLTLQNIILLPHMKCKHWLMYCAIHLLPRTTVHLWCLHTTVYVSSKH